MVIDRRIEFTRKWYQRACHSDDEFDRGWPGRLVVRVAKRQDDLLSK